jgi:hypothetical protein
MTAIVTQGIGREEMDHITEVRSTRTEERSNITTDHSGRTASIINNPQGNCNKLTNSSLSNGHTDRPQPIEEVSLKEKTNINSALQNRNPTTFPHLMPWISKRYKPTAGKK